MKFATSSINQTLLALLFSVSWLPDVIGRVFTDDSGRQVDAELVGVRGANVVLARGRRAAQWPIAKLSAADQTYVKEWRKNPPPVSLISVRIWERNGIGEAGTMRKSAPGGPPKNIPLLKQTEETANYKHYDVDLTNDTGHDATGLTVAYVLYVIGPDGKVSSQSGDRMLDLIAAGKRETVQTESVTYVRSKTTTTTFSVDRLEGLTTGSDTSRSKERFGGAWVRVYETDGSLVGEARELHPELERLKPAWTGSRGASAAVPGSKELELPMPGSFEELDRLLGVLKELKKNLPKLPPGLPKPPSPPAP